MERPAEEVQPPVEASGSDSEGRFWTGSIAAAGILALTCGILLAAGSRVSPELSWISKSFGRIGIFSGTVIGSGVLCIVLALLSHRLSRVGRKTRAAEKAVERAQALNLGMRHLVDRMTLIHAELAEVKDGVGGLLRVAKNQSNAKVAGMQVDATYHLAASMDQMGMRIEDRMRAQESTFDSRLMDLLGSVSTAQSHVDEILNDQEVILGDGDLLDAPEVEFDSCFDFEPLLPGEQDQGELEILADLEDAFESDPELENCDVSKFDWDAIEVSPSDDGLGLLDELDHDGTPLHEPTQAEADSALECTPTLHPEANGEADDELITKEALEEAWQAFKRQRDE